MLVRALVVLLIVSIASLLVASSILTGDLAGFLFTFVVVVLLATFFLVLVLEY